MTPELRARTLALLRELEWEGYADGWDCCPKCRALRGADEHAPDCEWDAVVKALEAEARAECKECGAPLDCPNGH